MMNICILSMQRVQNFGSLLQSYSLKKILEEMGHKVNFIDIKKIDKDNLLLGDKKNFFKEEREKENSFIPKLSKIDRYIINRILIKIKANKQDDVFNEFREKILGINGITKKQKYDVCIIGSDEVFNCLSEAPWGFTSQLFGNVEEANKVITYAASCGSTRYNELPQKVKERIREAFENISAFSVRDENTRDFVQKISGREDVLLNLDPVVIGDFDNEIKQYAGNIEVPEHYCIVYSYYNRIHNEKEIKLIKQFCKKRKLEIVTVGAPQKWIYNHLVLNPFEMLKVFSKANFVITDTFHGTIFAAKYSKRFAILVRESNKNKLEDLITRIGVEKHLLGTKNKLEDIFEVVNDIEKNKEISLNQLQVTKDYFTYNL